MTDLKKITKDYNQLPVETTRRADESEATVRNALDKHQSSTVTNLLHWRESQTLRDATTKEIKQGLDYRRQAIQMALDTRLQSMEEACNHVLLTNKTQLRQQRSLFFAEKLTELTHEMEQIANKFIHQQDERLDQLQKIRSERLRDREQQRIERSFDHFMDTLDQLEASFVHIIEEGVNRQ